MRRMCVIVEYTDYDAFETYKPLLQIIPEDEMHLVLWENTELFE